MQTSPKVPPMTKSQFETPVGALTILHRGGTVYICEFSDHSDRVDRQIARYHADDVIEDGPLCAHLHAAFKSYFAGDVEALNTVDAKARGTDFQRRVWKFLRSIPTGTTLSYGDMAKELSSAPRAVGQANGRNPVALIQPCHRVIGANGKLTGYAGGIERKDWLLKHEVGQSM